MNQTSNSQLWSRAYGVGFLLIAALLYTTRYLCTAILSAGKGDANFDYYYKSIGAPLSWLALAALICGLNCFFPQILHWILYDVMGFPDPAEDLKSPADASQTRAPL